jgi:tubulin--tyrosine ligase
MACPEIQSDDTIYALINYEDDYVQPLILSALAKHFPTSTYQLISSIAQLPSPSAQLLQFVQYEKIDFDHLLAYPATSLANAYVIRKALIRKHYLSTTVANWVTKYPESVLARCVKPCVTFEVDYAEFLDDALVEAWELKESWEKNEAKKTNEREWWILKPGMSERGQGIRLFSSEEELQAIFEEWDPPSDDEDDEDARSDQDGGAEGDGIMTNQLRHFVAQPYIHPPLLLAPPSIPSSPSALRKFHIRTYVLAYGALQVFVYRPMLALFAARPYLPPWDQDFQADREEAMRAHLTNTCLQDTGEREGSVGLFWKLPHEIPTQPEVKSPVDSKDWKEKVFKDICAITSETFEAAARGMSVHFQPLPNAFEIFGLDFMISVEPDGELRTWLLEVNAFPDFRQTGGELKNVVEGLFEEVVRVGVRSFFGVKGEGEQDVIRDEEGEKSVEGDMVKVLDIDLGRR